MRGAWHHIVLIHENTITKLYLDGNLVSTNSLTGKPLSAVGRPLIAGCRIVKSDYFYKGKLDDIELFNCALDVNAINDLYNVNLSTTTINQASTPKLDLYPNPSTGLINYSADKMIQQVELIDMTGKVILQQQNIHQQSGTITAKQNGCYLLKVYFEDASFSTKKVIINK